MGAVHHVYVNKSVLFLFFNCDSLRDRDCNEPCRRRSGTVAGQHAQHWQQAGSENLARLAVIGRVSFLAFGHSLLKSKDFANSRTGMVNLAVARNSKNEPRRMENYRTNKPGKGGKEGGAGASCGVSICERAFFHNIGRTGFVNPAATRARASGHACVSRNSCTQF